MTRSEYETKKAELNRTQAQINKMSCDEWESWWNEIFALEDEARKAGLVIGTTYNED